MERAREGKGGMEIGGDGVIAFRGIDAL